MLVYFSILFIILILCAFTGNNVKKNNYTLFFCIALIFLFMALRKDYGGDYSSYEDYYNIIHSAGSNSLIQIESGFRWIVILMSSYRMLLIVVAFLFSSALFFLFKMYIPVRYWALAFLILFISKSMLIGNMSGMRISIAVSAFIYSFYFLEQGKKLLYTILMIGASFFHTSVLFFLPAVFISPNKPSKIGILIIICSALVLIFISTFLPNAITQYVEMITEVSFFSKYKIYLVDKISLMSRGSSYLLIFFMLFFNIKILGQVTKKRESLFIKLSILYLLLMLAPSIGLMSRFYFFLSFPFLVGSIYVYYKKNDWKLRYAYIGCVVVLAGLEFYSFSSSGRFVELYLNYHSILF